MRSFRFDCCISAGIFSVQVPQRLWNRCFWTQWKGPGLQSRVKRAAGAVQFPALPVTAQAQKIARNATVLAYIAPRERALSVVVRVSIERRRRARIAEDRVVLSENMVTAWAIVAAAADKEGGLR